MGYVVGLTYVTIILGAIVTVASTIADTPGGILAGIALIVVGIGGAALTRRVFY